MEATLSSTASELRAVASLLSSAAEKLTCTATRLAPSSNSASLLNTPSKSPAILAYETNIIDKALVDFLKTSKSLGEPVLSLGSVLADIFRQMGTVVQIANECPIPTDGIKDPGFKLLLDPMEKKFQEIKQLELNISRASPPTYVNHAKAILNCGDVFLWALPGNKIIPPSIVAAKLESSDFYLNRVLKEFRTTAPEHSTWVNSLKTLFNELATYVKEWYPSGLTWNQKSANNLANSIELLSKKSTEDANVTQNKTGAHLFSAISEVSTIGLRKVDPSQMTHKNPNLRATVKESTNNDTTTTKQQFCAKPTTKVGVTLTPKLALAQNIWTVENHIDNNSLNLCEVELKHRVYIFGCKNCVVKITNKCNGVVMDKCLNTSLIVHSVVSTVEVINCNRVEVQAEGFVPTVTVDKSDAVQIHLSKESLLTEVLTAKAASVNIILPPTGNSFDTKEHSIVEQLKTVVKKDGTGIVTIPVEHKG